MMVDMAMREVVSAGPFTRIYDPGAGAAEDWYINDHTIIRGSEGRLHLFGITHPEPADPFDETEFAHATARELLGPWVKQRPALHVDRDYGETHLWAPFVVEAHRRYYMFYAGGGADRTAAAINLATSTDLFHWVRRRSGPLFRDGYDARDPMVTRVGDQWVMYYCATSTPAGGHHVVAYRTSSDLVHWGHRHIAYTDPTTGTEAGNTESPFVVQQDGWWYLFIGPRPTYVGTDVFRSDSPFRFRIGDKIGHIAAHAAEVLADADRWWITSAGWGQGGVHLAPLRFPRPREPHTAKVVPR
ncbi:glycosyl hydrolase family 32 domain-containing protein [Nocardia brasiliensis ATCC 700358]|uniref:Glycosyl hydrolase family 32 domain-containing protein n=2 Tax=Nocardia brasiliensis TaxID=37326 RepID=K0EP43_NOCB7|nr:glycosyl hydrolase family 32 domain-containing protein [Nocardia brasiliensis ATCC 700358]